mmetsp:Transcript_93250/g.241013  ORF Transcript_93250/g.241013 Transcript_93250/m.241013 type:complete len:227 (+) Transcript_93250:818-1498(+)
MMRFVQARARSSAQKHGNMLMRRNSPNLVSVTSATSLSAAEQSLSLALSVAATNIIRCRSFTRGAMLSHTPKARSRKLDANLCKCTGCQPLSDKLPRTTKAAMEPTRLPAPTRPCRSGHWLSRQLCRTTAVQAPKPPPKSKSMQDQQAAISKKLSQVPATMINTDMLAMCSTTNSTPCLSTRGARSSFPATMHKGSAPTSWGVAGYRSARSESVTGSTHLHAMMEA